MTEAVILTLIALASHLITTTGSVILAKIVAKSKPSHFKFKMNCVLLEINYENKADE